MSNGGLGDCATQQLVRFVAGHSEIDEFDSRFAAAVSSTAGQGEFRFDELLVAVVSDPAFRFRREEDVDDNGPPPGFSPQNGQVFSGHFPSPQEN